MNYQNKVGDIEKISVAMPSLQTRKPSYAPSLGVPGLDMSLIKMMMEKKREEQQPQEEKITIEPTQQQNNGIKVDMPSMQNTQGIQSTQNVQDIKKQDIQSVPLPETDKQITQPFGNPNANLYGYDVNGRPNINRGVDIEATIGEVQEAPKDGKWVVKEAYNGNDFNTGWGRSVVIENPDTGETIRRSHLDKVLVTPGQEVTGQALGTTGRTGRTTGYHMDIEYTDPNGKLADYTKTNYYNQQSQEPRAISVEDKMMVPGKQELNKPVMSASMQQPRIDLLGQPLPESTASAQPKAQITNDINNQIKLNENIPLKQEEKINKETTKKEQKSSNKNFGTFIEREASRTGLPINLLDAQIQAESAGNPNAVSPAGAAGVSQFIPSTARAYGLRVDDQVDERFDPEKAIKAQADYMSDLLKQYGTVERALSAYNSGKPDAYLNPNFAGGETYNYVKRILNLIGGN